MTEPRRLCGRFISLALLLAGCGDDGADPAGGGGSGAGPASSSSASSTSATGGGGAGPGLDIEWTPCPLSSDDETGDGAFCATIEVPLDWNDPDGAKIDFFVKKVPGQMQPPRGQLWLLNGGPGYSGADFEPGAQAVTVDLYLPDHRGTGRSSRLGCPVQESDESPGGFGVTDEELSGCLDAIKLEWGSNLSGFTTTNAARDVGEVIAATRLPTDDILIDGGSYGSMWANRYLQLYPDQADGVVMDAFAVGLLMTRDDVYFNQLGEKWMDACGAHAECSSRLGADPWDAMTQALASLDAGACPGMEASGWSRAELHKFWAFFFYTWDLRSLIAPMVYRIARCEPRDVAAMANLYDVFTQPGQPTAADRYFSVMLFMHVVLSELWEDPPPTVAELQAIQDSANVAHRLMVPAQMLYDAWPRYPKDAWVGDLAVSQTPILMVRGEYDFIPMSAIQPAVDHFSSVGTFVEIPHAPHGMYQAPQSSNDPPCGFQVRAQFFADPTATLDTSCLSGVAPLPLLPPSGLSSAAFGTADAFDGTPSSASIVTPELARAAAAFRRFEATRLPAPARSREAR